MTINVLNLEGISPADIEENAPLFHEGLGLDSIDALKIAVLLNQKYGVKIKPDDRNADIFASLKALADFVCANRNGKQVR